MCNALEHLIHKQSWHFHQSHKQADVFDLFVSKISQKAHVSVFQAGQYR